MKRYKQQQARRNKLGTKSANGIQLAWFSLSVIVSTLFGGAASANPGGAQVVHGQANIQANGSTLTVTNTPGAIINWQQFSIQRNEVTRFMQQHGKSAVLNRVTGRLPSDILGELTSNGKVFVINPNGLVVGKGARIDTAGFLGSTLDISNEDFLAGRLNFSGAGGKLENHGVIAAGKGGEVVLIAPTVENHGVIEAPDGKILLAAGREVTLTSLNDANIAYKVSAPGDTALNLGKLLAENGSVKVFADQISHVGEISANRVSQAADGSIVLEADTQMSVSGQLSASGQGTAGGEVRILGEQVALNGASIDVSGSTGGGSALVGGDYKGGNGVRTAARTEVDVSSVVNADAKDYGDGGKVIIWSDVETNSYGKLSARGGTQGGDGGLVETSSKGKLDFGQPADVSAPNGQPGTWLLDPEDINIGGGHAASISSSLNGGSNVHIETSDSGSGEGNISVNAPISKTEGPDASLSMRAHNRIDVNAPITSTEGKLNVSLSAGANIAVNAPVSTNGGSFSTAITGVATEEPPAEEAPVEEEAAEEEVTEEAPAEESPTEEPAPSEVVAEDSPPPAEEVPLEPVLVPPVETALEPPAQPEQPLLPQPEVAPVTISAPSVEVVGAAPTAPTSVVTTELTKAQATVRPPAAVASAPPPPASAPDVEAVQPTQPEEALFVDTARNQIVIRAEVNTGGGEISVDAGENGDVVVSGTLDSSSSTQQGGNITIEAERIALVDNAVVDASGEGGGEVLIGGGQQGNDPGVQNAQFTHIGENVAVHSDGGLQGDGGRVIVYADNTANVQGTLTAIGGSQGGDGGFIETSGKHSMRVENAPDVSAGNGEAGEWLIDPISVTITDGVTDVEVVDTDLTANGYWQPLATGATISSDSVGTVLGSGGDVTITTSEVSQLPPPADISLQFQATGLALDEGDINWEADLDLDGASATGNLTLLAHNDINWTGSIYDSNLGTGAGDDRVQSVTLVADWEGVNGGESDGLGDINIGSDTGDVFMQVGNGGVTMSAANVNISGDVMDIDGVMQPTTVNISSQGDIAIGTADNPIVGDVNISGGSHALSTGNSVRIGANGTNSNVVINAGNDINIQGGSGDGNNVLIKSGGEGEIALDAGGTLAITGGSGASADVRLQSKHHRWNADGGVVVRGGDGAGSAVVANASATNYTSQSVDHTISTTGDLQIYAGQQSGVALVTTNMDIDVGGNMIVATLDNTSPPATAITVTGKDQLDVDVAGNISISHGENVAGSTIRLRGGSVDMDAGGNIDISSGTGGNAATITAEASDSHLNMAAAGDISLNAAAGSTVAVSATGSSDAVISAQNALIDNASIDAGDVSINTQNDLGVDDSSISATNHLAVAVGNKMTVEGGSSIRGNTANITTNDFDWQAGTIEAFTSGTMTTTGTTNITTSNDKYLRGMIWNQQGTANWDDGDIRVSNTTINNSGVFNMNGDDSMLVDYMPGINYNVAPPTSDVGAGVYVGTSTVDSTFHNTGTVNKAGGGTTYMGRQLPLDPYFPSGELAVINEGMLNLNAGELHIESTLQQTGDTSQTDLNGGSLTLDKGFSLDGGKLVGDGIITGDVNATKATIAPGHSPGTITVNGNFTSTSQTQYDFEIGGEGAGTYDQLVVTGSADVNGAMNIDFINGYSPIVSGNEDSFDLITASTMTGSLGAPTHSNLPTDVTVSDQLDSGAFNVTYRQDVTPLPPIVPEPPAPPVVSPVSPPPVPSPTPLPSEPITELPSAEPLPPAPLPPALPEIIVAMQQPPEPEEELKGDTVEGSKEETQTTLLMCTASYQPQ